MPSRALVAFTDGPEPMRFGRRAPEAPRIVLFEIDGEQYTMPATVPAGVAIALSVNLARLADKHERGIHLLRELCGPDAVAALLGESTMTGDDWDELIGRARHHALGDLEEDDPGN